MVMAHFQTHQKMLNLTVWEAQPDEKSVILQPLGGIVNANNLLQHESSHESNGEPLRTACKLAFGYCSLSFCGQITTTVDWLQLLNMFGNFICSYCRHNKLVGHILRGSAFLLDFLIVCATDTSWAPNRFPTCLFFFCIRRDPLGRSYRKAWGGCPGVSPGITSMCPHLWSRASPNSVAWHGSSAGVSSVVLKRGWDIPELNGGLVRWENNRLLNGGYSIATFRYRRV